MELMDELNVVMIGAERVDVIEAFVIDAFAVENEVLANVVIETFDVADIYPCEVT